MNRNFEFIWDEWSESDNEEMVISVRGQYKMTDRIDHFNKWDDIDFFMRFRLRKETVAKLLYLVKPYLEDKTERSRNITSIGKLLIALRFYALGTMLLSVGDFSGVCKSTISLIVRRVSFAIASLRKQFIKMPETDYELNIASLEFYNVAKFPKTIGAIDCTHVKIQSPGGHNADYSRNRKGVFSLNVQTVCSANLKFLNIFARWPGATHDQTILNNSRLRTQLEQNVFKEYILVADSGYANSSYMTTPVLSCNNYVEQLYNESLIRSRNTVERQYGVWKRRFPVLSQGMRLMLPTIQDIIVATAVLHNICIDFNEEIPPNSVDLESIAIDEPFEIESISRDRVGTIRSILLADYFPTFIIYIQLHGEA